MIPLRSRESLPLDRQVAEGLTRLIGAGAFGPGEKLPPPEELAWRSALNPKAVRRAYEDLTAKGVLERRENDFFPAERREEP